MNRGRINLLREWVKTGLANAVHQLHVDNWLAKRAAVQSVPLVIAYHRIVPNVAASGRYTMPAQLTSTRTFERHLDWLGRRYRFITLDELDAGLGQNVGGARPGIAITFDDGYNDIYQHALPILRRKGIPATVFVVSDLIDTRQLLIHDELYLLLLQVYRKWPSPAKSIDQLLCERGQPPVLANHAMRARDPAGAVSVLLQILPQRALRKLLTRLSSGFGLDAGTDMPPPAYDELCAMTWAMLREMQRNGISVGSHSATHASLPNESKGLMHREIDGSRRLLERQLGATVAHFAYPGGHVNRAVTELVAKAGYHSAYTSCQHRDRRFPALTVPRRLLWENACLDALGQFSPAIMSCQLSGVFDRFAPCSLIHRF